MRLNRYLARAGLGSRRSVEQIIRSGRVRISGRAGLLHSRVDPDSDTVTLDGRPVRLPVQHSYIILHKPRGYTTSRSDTHAASTVYELLPARYRTLPYVGRLDRESEGLLIFTDDGDLSYRLQRPEFGVEREYVVFTHTSISAALIRRILAGVDIGDGERARICRASFEPRRAGGGRLHLVLTEGKKREVRRICRALDIDIQRLLRERFGPVSLGRLAPGQVRALTASECARLASAAQKPIPKPRSN